MKQDQVYQDRRAKIDELRAKNERMTSRERAKKAINFEEADRVTIDNWMVPEIKKRCTEHWGCDSEEELLAFLGIDVRDNYGPSYTGQEFKKFDDGTVADLWGVRRKSVTYGKPPYEGVFKEVAWSPLEHMETVAEIEAYEGWPSPDWWDYSKMKEECAYWHPQYFVLNKGDRLDRTAQLKPMMYLRGIQQTFIDLAQNPKIVECIRDHVVGYFCEYDPKVFEAGGGEVDMFMMGDDIGGQRGPLLSLDMWRRYFRDGFRKYCDIAHNYGLKVMYHTCGDVYQFIPDLIENGLDMLQSLQPQATNMDIKRLKREFGKDLAFQGGMDIQQVLPLGTPEDVRKMVKYAADNAKQGGGYFFGTSHNIQTDTPIENVAALFEAYHEYGVY
ncbi:MAG TPA: uroporphyrinogen decarboxylase family protein [Deferrisomatales bacterium]|nr:uroporphyrinogen decarboxylase family protein [Deferrisomatales bacterium]